MTYTLKDLRVAQAVPRHKLAGMLSLEVREYTDIEKGQQKPTIDTLRDLAAVYGTSMDFMYHAFYAQAIRWKEAERDLDYALRRSKANDLLFIGNWNRPYHQISEGVNYGECNNNG